MYVLTVEGAFSAGHDSVPADGRQIGGPALDLHLGAGLPAAEQERGHDREDGGRRAGEPSGDTAAAGRVQTRRRTAPARTPFAGGPSRDITVAPGISAARNSFGGGARRDPVVAPARHSFGASPWPAGGGCGLGEWAAAPAGRQAVRRAALLSRPRRSYGYGALGARRCTASRCDLQCQPLVAAVDDDHTFSPLVIVQSRCRRTGGARTGDSSPFSTVPSIAQPSGVPVRYLYYPKAILVFGLQPAVAGG